MMRADRAATVITLLPLFVILTYLFAKGRLEPQPRVFHPPAGAGGREGRRGGQRDRRHAWSLSGAGCLIGVPIGIRRGRSTWPSIGGSRFAARSRFAADVMTGVPSIVVGIFAYAVVVRPMGRFSALAGAVALAVIMIPVGDAHHRGDGAAGAARVCARRRWRWACRDGARRCGWSRGTRPAVLPPARSWRSRASPARPRRCCSRPSATASGRPHSTNPIASLTVQIYTYAISPFPIGSARRGPVRSSLTTIVLALESGVRWMTRAERAGRTLGRYG